MFEWIPYVGNELTALSDTGNSYYITAVEAGSDTGRWTAGAIMANGKMYKPREFPSRRYAEGYCEELEVEHQSPYDTPNHPAWGD